MTYQYIATTPEGLVQRVAVHLVPHGYLFHTSGVIPYPKEPGLTDQKLIGKYGIDVGRHVRVQQKKDGVARVQYVRHQRFFVLLATHGQHPIFQEERLKDLRESPLRFFGYSISYRRGVDGKLHPSVRIELQELKRLKALFLADATRPLSWWRWRFHTFEYASYAPAIRQAHILRRAVNRVRKEKNLKEIPAEFVRWERKPVKVFE